MKTSAEIEIDQCGKCNKSMQPEDFAFIADEDLHNYHPELFNYLAKYDNLCGDCLKKLVDQYEEQEDIA